MAILVGFVLAVKSCATACLCTSIKADLGEELLLLCELFSKVTTIPFLSNKYLVLSLYPLPTLDTGTLFYIHSVNTRSGGTGGQDYRGLGEVHKKKLLRLRKICGL